MFKEIFRFELRLQVKRHLTYICAILFFLFGFGAISSDWVIVGGAIGNVNRNSPYVIMQIMLIMSVIGVFVTTAFVAPAVQRDCELDMSALFYTKPITRWGYLGGRFFGALVIAFIPLIATALGMWMGSLMPWIEAERLGPFSLTPYVFSFVALVAPNVLLTGAIFFALATLTRSMLFTYVSVVALFVGYGIAGVFLGDLESEFLAGLVDPFAFGPFGLITQYWTAFEKNTTILPLGGVLLWNRILWLTVAGGIFTYTFTRFRFDVQTSERRKRNLDDELPEDTDAVPTFVLAAGSQRFSRATALHQYAHESRREFASILKSAPFIVLALFAVLNFASLALVLDQLFGTTVYPVTYLIVDIIEGGFALFLFIVLTFYSGDLIWKERTLKLNEVRDALPTPTWVAWAAKLTAIMGAILVLLICASLTGMGMQVFSGFFQVEFAVYVKGVFATLGADFLILAVLAFGLQVATNNKYLGYLAMVVYLVAIAVLPALGFEHRLYRFGERPGAPYSDMNHYGHFVAPTVSFLAYWGFLSVVLISLAHLFWMRGTDSSWRSRWKVARQRLSPQVVTSSAVGLTGFGLMGGFIFYNTNVLNTYRTSDDQTLRRVEWETKYKQYEGLAQPRITGVYVDAAIYPAQRAARISGTYRLENKTDSAIGALHVRMNPNVERFEFGIAQASIEMSDTVFGYYIYRFDEALAPGDTMMFGFEVEVVPHGFANSGSNTALVYNGSFFNNIEYFPHLGYDRGPELSDPNDRRKHDLPEAERMPPLSDDPAARANHYISTESDWVNFETVVSTSPDQIAIAPGYLQREWEENGRRYFHYKMDAPILNFFSFLSADYTVLRDRWNDVNIEIYYHRSHDYNLDRMVEGIKKSLEYYSANFSLYQHRQARIIEFPRYANFAQAFPNTIPYSEGLGFIARIDDEEDIDYVFYVTAHEIGHQWWAHQVIGAGMQGATLMSETMAQYAALMVMEKEYGKDKMRRFLRYELDQYLQGRSNETLYEQPLLLVENQSYIHYNKGSLVMYALRDYIGEETLNAALARYVDDVAFQGPPYTNSREFVSYLREATPDSLQYVIEDMFETITLYDNRATDAVYRDLGDGTYAVTLELSSTKFRADGKGVETEIAVNDWIDVGVFGEGEVDGVEQEIILYLKKHRIDGSTTEVEVIVDQLPLRAGIDPHNKLIDRNPDDNVTRVRHGRD
ncbi:MAG: M1 family aminopeptidase [Gemmatimonadetes bacterium]|nr:M1 family aminopeptidase [Gemmatimonadota bacterium]